jgi:hypothetical protein
MHQALVRSFVVTLALGLAAGDALAQNSEVQAIGVAAIMGGDKAAARDRAIADAQRKAVEQAVGTMVSSETVTENFELVSDKIFSKAKGYVKKYQIVTEKEDSGTIMVTIKATVGAGDLKKDLDGVLGLLRAKDMPRVLLMIAEQNVGDSNANFWWGEKNFAVNLDAAENGFIDAWIPKGIRFVDRQALLGKIEVGPALSSAEPTNDAIKSFASKTGAEIVIKGKAVASDQGPIMGTQMHSIRADISLVALNLDNARIIGTAVTSKVANHINPITGGTRALKSAAQHAADELLGKMLAQWQSDVHGATTISLTVKGVKKMRVARKMIEALKTNVRGVEDARQKSYRKKVSTIEVEIKGSAQDLATALEEKKFSGMSFEVDEVTGNTVSATLK